MADEIKLKAPTVEQQVVVNINGEEKLKAFSDTLDKISNNKNLQKYWKTQEELINATTEAYGNFQKKASQDNASELIKIVNALKAVSKTDLSHVLPDFDKISKGLADAQKIVGSIDSAFSVNSFKTAFDSFEALEAYGTDVSKILQKLGTSADVDGLRGQIDNLSRSLEGANKRIEQLQYRNGSLLDELYDVKSGSKVMELEGQLEELRSLSDITVKDFKQSLGHFGFSEYDFDLDPYITRIKEGVYSASGALSDFKSDYKYLFEDTFNRKDNVDNGQLSKFESSLIEVLKVVQNTATGIKELQDQIQMLSVPEIQDDFKGSDESLKQILNLFEKINDSLSSLRSVISDVGDGEEFSPLLKTIKEITTAVNTLSKSVSNIGLNVNIESGGMDQKLLSSLDAKKQSLLSAYKTQFDAMRAFKPSGTTVAMANPENRSRIAALNKQINNFDGGASTDNIDQRITAYKEIIKLMKEVLQLSYGKDIYSDMDSSFKTAVSSATGQVTRVQNELKKANIDGTDLENLFGSQDLSKVVEQLSRIADQFENITRAASEFKTKFADGIKVESSVQEIETLTNKVKELEAEISKLQAPLKTNISSPKNTPSETVGGSAEDLKAAGNAADEAGKKVENSFKAASEAAKTATENAKEYERVLSQVGQLGVDENVSAVYQKNDGQLESVRWKAKRDKDKNIVRDDNDNIVYDIDSTIISKYEQLEKIIVKADNEIRDLERDMKEVQAYDPKASTQGIQDKIKYQKDYIDLLMQTVKAISQSDEYLLIEKQILDARAKAEKEYNLTINAKKDKTDAKQSAADQKKLQDNIDRTNRALAKQENLVQSIHNSYDKSVSTDRYVDNTADLSALNAKETEIRNLISKLQGQGRNSSNEKEFLELEKLIAEYKELAKYKLKENNPTKQELGGQKLSVLIADQIAKYDELIAKEEKYGDATKDVVEQLKKQRDILAATDKDGKYTATADQFYDARDEYKIQSSAFKSNSIVLDKAKKEQADLLKTQKQIDVDTKKFDQASAKLQSQKWDSFLQEQEKYESSVNEINSLISKTDELLAGLPIPKELDAEFLKLIDDVEVFNEKLRTGGDSKEYDANINSLVSDYLKKNSIQQKRDKETYDATAQEEQNKVLERQKQLWDDISSSLGRYETLQKRIAQGKALEGDVEEAKALRDHINELQRSDILPVEKLNASNKKLREIDQTVSDLKKQTDAANADRTDKDKTKQLNKDWNEAIKYNEALNDTQKELSKLSVPKELEKDRLELIDYADELRNKLVNSNELELPDYKKQIKAKISDYNKNVKIQQNRDKETYDSSAEEEKNRLLERQELLWNDLSTSLMRYETLQKRIANGKPLENDNAESEELLNHICALQRMDILPTDKLKAYNEKLRNITQTVAELEEKLKQTTIDNVQKSINKYEKMYNDRSATPADYNQNDTYKKNLGNLADAINNLKEYKATLSGVSSITDEQKTTISGLTAKCEECANAFKAMSAAEKGSDDLSRAKLYNKIGEYLQKNSGMAKEFKVQLKALQKQIENEGPNANTKDLTNQFIRLKSQIREAGQEGRSFLDILKDKAFYGFVGQLGTYFGFNDFIRYIGEGINTVRELDTAMTEMRKVSDESVASLKDFQKESFDIANAVGTTAKQIQTSTADWMRLGETLEQAKESAKDANVLLNVSEYDNIEEATQALVSMSQAYKELDKMDIINVLNKIGNEYSISTDELSTALKDSAAVLKTQNNDLAQSVALITAGKLVTCIYRNIYNRMNLIAGKALIRQSYLLFKIHRKSLTPQYRGNYYMTV